MRKFARSHWKVLIAILLAIALATLTLETDSAPPSPAPKLSARLRGHVEAIASAAPGSTRLREAEQAARHIEASLQDYGYQPRRQQYQAGGRKVRNIEVSVSNNAPGARPQRIFIVGARYAAASHSLARGAPSAGRSENARASGPAAVLELARLLRSMRPSRGTEVKFVFFVEPPEAREAMDAGSFIAFAGTLDSSARVRHALAAFQAHPGVPDGGLAAPSHVMGMRLSDHSTYPGQGYPALVITDTAFLRYPYHRTADATPDELGYVAMARVVKELARTIESLAGAARM